MLSDKIGTIKQDLADLKGRIYTLPLTDEELQDKFEKLEDDLKEYLETIQNCLVDLR